MKPFTVLDLYSGAGGFSEGILKAHHGNLKFNVVVANDYDPHATETYTINHPEVDFVFGDIGLENTKEKILKSIRKSSESSKIDVIIGGPPCKGFSKANTTTRVKSNPLNQLPFEFIEMVKRVNPFAFIMENVPGMLSLEKGNFAKKIITHFYNLGYENVDCWVLNAADFGVPQLRKRAFIIGSKSNHPISKPKETHDDDGILNPYTSLSNALSDLPYIPPGKSMPLIKAYRSEPKNKFQTKMRTQSNLVKNHRITVSEEIVIRRFKTIPQGGNWRDIPKRLIQINGKYKDLKNMHGMIYRRLSSSKPSVTITNFRKAMLIHPTQNRLLSVREAARIQTFPDRYEFRGPLHSMQQQVSDAVPVNLSTSIGISLLKHLQKSMQQIPSNTKRESKLKNL